MAELASHPSSKERSASVGIDPVLLWQSGCPLRHHPKAAQGLDPGCDTLQAGATLAAAPVSQSTGSWMRGVAIPHLFGGGRADPPASEVVCASCITLA